MTRTERLLREEQSVYMEHRKDFKEYTARMQDEWLERIYSPNRDKKDEEASLRLLSSYADDLEGSIQRDPELTKLYIASSITLAAERGRKELLPEESLERIKRQSFVKLAKAEDVKELRQISAEAAARFREIYLKYCMEGYSYPVREAIEEIHRSRFQSVRAGKIAEEIGVSPSYLSRIFRKETGKTITRYMTDLKMETAKDLMRGHLYSLQEISEMLGYQSYAYFSRVFRKTVGMAPENFPSSL